MNIKNRVFKTTFVVLPKHCNYMYPMIFGGALFSELDLCAASCVNRALHDSECDSAVTHKYEGTFHTPAELGDLIFLRAEIVEVRKKAIVAVVEAWRERRATKGRDKIADTKFVFISKKENKFCPHGLNLKEIYYGCKDCGEERLPINGKCPECLSDNIVPLEM